MPSCNGNSDCNQSEFCDKVTSRCTNCQLWCPKPGLSQHIGEECWKRCPEYARNLESTPTTLSSYLTSLSNPEETGDVTSSDSSLVTLLLIVLILVILVAGVTIGLHYWMKRNRGPPNIDPEDPADGAVNIPLQPEYPGGDTEQEIPENQPDKHRMVTGRERHPSGPNNRQPYPPVG